jgi:DNA repair protein RadC
MNLKTDHLTMRRLPAADRPYEKMTALGPQALSDAELLAVIIRSGSRRESALALCQRLLAMDEAGRGLSHILESSLEELMALPGIGRVKAAQMKAALEIGSRVATGSRHASRHQIRTPEDAINLLEREMRILPREELRIVLLDVRNRVIRVCRISEGGLSSSVIYPRDLFREAVKANAAALILAHNHPSGDASPSREDMETTRRLIEAGEMMGIKIVDHVILAADGCISFKQSGLI